MLLLLGLLLAVAAMPVSHDTKEEASPLVSGSSETGDTARSELEAKLEALLSGTEGAGEVRVMLMTGEGENAGGFYGTGETEVTGVLIAAQGADDPVVVQNIQKAVMALFQIEAHKINIMKMK